MSELYTELTAMLHADTNASNNNNSTVNPEMVTTAKPKRVKCTDCGVRHFAPKGFGIMCPKCRASGNYRHDGVAKNVLMGKGAGIKAVSYAVKSGVLPLASLCTCVDCGKPALQHEHRDYNKPLDVVPVCKSCNCRRGPAIPLRGGITKMVNFGFVPYGSKRRVEQLFEMLGLDKNALDRLPNKKLDYAAWVSILPAFAAFEESA